MIDGHRGHDADDDGLTTLTIEKRGFKPTTKKHYSKLEFDRMLAR